MKLPYIHFFSKLSIIALLFCSCASDLDFNQLDDLKIEPVIAVNLTSFENKANDFIDDGAEQNMVFDAVDFDVFRNRFLRDNLMKTQFDFEIENTIYRPFTINFVFLDRNSQVTHKTEIDVPVYAGLPNVVNHTDILEHQALDLFKNSVKLKIEIVMLPGTPLNSNSLGRLKLRSGAILNFEIK